MIDQTGGDLVPRGNRRIGQLPWGLNPVERAVEHHARRRHRPRPCRSGGHIRVLRLQPHFPIERPDDEFAQRDRPAVGQEGAHAQIGVNAVDLGGVYFSVRMGGDAPIVDAFAA